MSKTELSMYSFPEKTIPLTVLDVSSLFNTHTISWVRNCDHFLLSLQCLLIYHILPTWSQKCLWNLAIPFISTAIIQAWSLTWTIRVLFPDSSLSSTLPVELLLYETHLIMLPSYLSTPCGSLFFPIESSPNSLAWLNLSEISLTPALIVISHPSLSQTLCSEPLSCSLFIVPTKVSDPLWIPFTYATPFAWQIHFQTRVSSLKHSLVCLMHSYSCTPSLLSWYFVCISVTVFPQK